MPRNSKVISDSESEYDEGSSRHTPAKRMKTTTKDDHVPVSASTSRRTPARPTSRPASRKTVITADDSDTGVASDSSEDMSDTILSEDSDDAATKKKKSRSLSASKSSRTGTSKASSDIASAEESSVTNSSKSIRASAPKAAPKTKRKAKDADFDDEEDDTKTAAETADEVVLRERQRLETVAVQCGLIRTEDKPSEPHVSPPPGLTRDGGLDVVNKAVGKGRKRYIWLFPGRIRMLAAGGRIGYVRGAHTLTPIVYLTFGEQNKLCAPSAAPISSPDASAADADAASPLPAPVTVTRENSACLELRGCVVESTHPLCSVEYRAGTAITRGSTHRRVVFAEHRWLPAMPDIAQGDAEELPRPPAFATEKPAFLQQLEALGALDGDADAAATPASRTAPTPTATRGRSRIVTSDIVSDVESDVGSDMDDAAAGTDDAGDDSSDSDDGEHEEALSGRARSRSRTVSYRYGDSDEDVSEAAASAGEGSESDWE